MQNLNCPSLGVLKHGWRVPLSAPFPTKLGQFTGGHEHPQPKERAGLRGAGTEVRACRTRRGVSGLAMINCNLRLVHNGRSTRPLLAMSTLGEPPYPARLQLTPAQIRTIARSLTQKLMEDRPCTDGLQPQMMRAREEGRLARARAGRTAEAWDVSRSPLDQLRAEAGLPVHSPHRTVSKKMLADARLLMTLRKPARLLQEPPSKTLRAVRCGRCDECLKADCGTCYNCQDKRRFGGQGIRKQACKMRSCVHARSDSVVILTDDA